MAHAHPLGQQANFSFKLFATLSENMGHYKFWLLVDQASLHTSLKTTSKFVNQSSYNQVLRMNSQETSDETEIKMEGDNPILLIYASLYKYGSVKERLQATHPKSPMLKCPMNPKDFLDKA